MHEHIIFWEVLKLKTDNELDNELCERARSLGGHATQAEAIHNALERCVDYLQLQTSADGKQNSFS